MKKKFKMVVIVLVATLVISCGYSIYQNKEISNYNERLTRIVESNIESFVGKSGNVEDIDAFAEQYASLVAAQEAYIALDDDCAVPQDEEEYNLSILIIQIKAMMLNDKDKFNKVFNETEAGELMYKISDDIYDKESIHKVYKLVTE